MPTYNERGALLVDISGGTFIGLSDTPAAYAGNANRVLAVNAVPDAIIFGTDLYWIEATSRMGINDSAPNNMLCVGGSTPAAFAGIDATVAIIGGNVGRVFLEGSVQVDTIWYDSGGVATYEAIQFINAGGISKFRIFNDAPWGVSIDNVLVVEMNTGDIGINDGAPSRKLQVVDDSASTNTIIPIIRIESQVSGGAGAAGHGPGFEFYGESSTTENTSMAEIVARWSVATHASRRARIEMYAAYIGTDVLCGVIEAPASASADGNARGIGAVDLQGVRNAVTQVASGNYSALIAGSRSIASGSFSAVIAGSDSEANASYSAVIAGTRGLADKRAQIVSSSGLFAATGDAQGTIQMVVRIARATHAVNTWYSLYLDGAAQQMTIAAETAWSFHILVVGITNTAAQQWGYEITGLIERDNAGNTTLAASAVTVIFESDANYDAQVVADNVNEALEVQVRRTGGVDYNVRWVATVRMAEVTY